ncbi:hypothetical protein H8E07_10345, partial [bacterium]|nr:hypothetical protein [bacterium]
MTGREDARDLFRGVTALSPMATGGNLPYRRLRRGFRAGVNRREGGPAHQRGT